MRKIYLRTLTVLLGGLLIVGSACQKGPSQKEPFVTGSHQPGETPPSPGNATSGGRNQEAISPSPALKDRQEGEVSKDKQMTMKAYDPCSDQPCPPKKEDPETEEDFRYSLPPNK